MDDHIKAEISTYLAGALTESRNRQIEAHVAACDKCRSALSRARNKQARIKREALKNASTEKVPNFFHARQGKEFAAGAFFRSQLFKRIGFLVIVAGVIYWGVHRTPSQAPEVPGDSSAAASEADAKIEKITTASAQKVNAPPKSKTPDPALPAKETTPALTSLPASTTTQIVIPKAPEVPKAPLILPVVESWKGPESAIHENRVLVVRTQEGFQKLWTEMKVSDPQPVIDFSDKVVIAIFAGPFAPGSMVEIGKIEEAGDAMLAPYRINTAAPATTVSTASAPAIQNFPYMLAMVPRIDRKIKISRRESF